MTTKKILLFSFMLISFLSFSNYSFAQPSKKYTISGKVVENGTKSPLEYATISVMGVTDPNYLNGVVSSEKGDFSIDVPEGTYTIKIEFISFESKSFTNKTINSDLDLGTISLSASSANLDEVVVQAQTTQVEVRLDKKIYNIGKDLTTAGGTVSDALNNVPSVAVDVEGAISLRGNDNVRVLINGKPSAMAGFGGTDVLGQLPADAIERVEVITSPSARYDAQGTAGIINIILKKEKTLGFNGSITANLGTPADYGLTGNVNLRKDKFNIFNTTSFNYRDVPGEAHFDTHYKEGLFDRVVENRDYNRLRRGFNTNLGMEYYLSDQSSITGTFFFRLQNNNDVTLNHTDKFQDNELVQKTLRKEDQDRDQKSYQYSLNYTNKLDDKGQKLTADLQYEYQDQNQPSFITENATFDNTEGGFVFLPSEEVFNAQTEKEFLAQTDYVLPLGEDSQFEAGYRGDFETDVTNYKLNQEDSISHALVLQPFDSNKFTYKENVNAIYSQYGTKFGDLSFLLGLRLEQTQLNGKIDSEFSDDELSDYYGIPINTDFNKNYLGLFPTVNLIYGLSDTENLTLGYNRRINRPWSYFINPFPSRSSRTNVFQGNPNLDPAYASAFDLGYLNRWEKLTLTSSVYYQHENHAFERVQQGTGQYFNGIEIIRTIPINLSTNDRFGAELGILYNPAKWLRLNGSFNYFQFKSTGEYNGTDYGSTNDSYFARFSSKVSLPFKIDWQTNAFYRGPSENSQTKTDGIVSVDLAFSKDLFHDNATLSLNVRDLLNSRKRDSYTVTNRFTQDSQFRWRRRQATLSFTYRFNQQKNQQRKKELNNNNVDDPQGEFQG